MVKKMFIEIRLCNLTYVFKGHVNVLILNGLKIIGFL